MIVMRRRVAPTIPSSGGIATPYRAYVEEIAKECRPLATDEARARMARLSALVTSYLFLLWFDTRSGYQDTGPYRLADGRTLLLRSGLPTAAPVIGAARALELMGMDKKVLAGRIRLVLVKRLGEGVVSGDYSADALTATLESHFGAAA